MSIVLKILCFGRSVGNSMPKDIGVGLKQKIFSNRLLSISETQISDGHNAISVKKWEIPQKGTETTFRMEWRGPVSNEDQG